MRNFQKKLNLNCPYNSGLKIWSAACSIGAEPYSLAMIMDNLNSRAKHKIVATDIDSTILTKSKKW